MNGNEARALKGLQEKMKYIPQLLTLMLVHGISQSHLANLADVPYTSVKKAFRTPSHASVKTFEHLLSTLIEYENKLKEDFPDYGY